MSLKRIAEMTGTSVSTVSRVLNHPDYQCQDKTLSEKIREAARTLHYIPDSSARQLRQGGIVQKDEYKVDILQARFQSLKEDAFFEEVYRYLAVELMQRQCSLNQVLMVPDIAQMGSGKMPVRSDGVVILGKCPAEMVDILHRKYRAVVAIDRNPTEHKMDEVVCDGAKAAKIGVEYLYELGHRKIAYVGDCSMEARYAGYYECLISHKVSLQYEYVISTGQTRDEGYQAYDRLAALPYPPTAVFCANDVSALGFLQAMKDRTGLKRKEAYRPAVVSIDDIDMASRFSPMLTTVHIPKEELVHIAVLMLRDRLQGGHREYMRTELPCHLIIRESSGIHVL